MHRADLVPGSDVAVLTWCGRNWTGPSDFNNPIGAPFPPGTYRFEVKGRGTWVDEDGNARDFEVSASYGFELLP